MRPAPVIERKTDQRLGDDLEHPIEGEVLSAPAVDLARAYGLRELPSVVVVRRGRGADLIELEAITLDRLQALVTET